jgi:hypothetical protein
MHQPKFVVRVSHLLAVVLLSSGWETASRASFTTFEAAGANPAAITPTRDAFRTAVGGGTTAGADGSFGGVRREINWDGVPDTAADPNPLPANFFNTTSPRGVTFTTNGTGFLVSANSGLTTPPLFGFPNDFAAFSSQRLFTAVNGEITDVHFFVPGTNTPATTSAFGVVFNDIEAVGSTHIAFFDQNNTQIYTRDALVAGNQGQTFLGAVANAGEQISRVEIMSGNNTITSNGVLGDQIHDIVVMDDFLFAEPTAVPEPASLSLAALGLMSFSLRLRRRT